MDQRRSRWRRAACRILVLQDLTRHPTRMDLGSVGNSGPSREAGSCHPRAHRFPVRLEAEVDRGDRVHRHAGQADPGEPASTSRYAPTFLASTDLRLRVGEGRRLPIVDDTAMQLKLARIQFSHLGFDVSTASSARERRDGGQDASGRHSA